MEIGGQDIVLEMPEGVAITHLHALFSEIEEVWPQHVISVSDHGRWFIVHRDDEAERLSDKLGHVPETFGVCVQIIFRPTQLTIVVDENGGMQWLVDRLLAALGRSSPE